MRASGRVYVVCRDGNPIAVRLTREKAVEWAMRLAQTLGHTYEVGEYEAFGAPEVVRPEPDPARNGHKR